MTNPFRRPPRWRLRKPLALLICAALLETQQGFFVSEAGAQIAAPARASGPALLSPVSPAVSLSPGFSASAYAAPMPAAFGLLGAGAPSPGLSGSLSVFPTIAGPAAPRLAPVSAISPLKVVPGLRIAPAVSPLKTAPQAVLRTRFAKVGDSVFERGPSIGLRALFDGTGSNSGNVAGRSGVAQDSPLGPTDETMPPPEEWDPEVSAPAGAPKSLAEVSLDVPADRVYTPSPEDWRDEIFYNLLIDRFERGPGAATAGDPNNGRSRHGGNLKGIIRRLDYIRESGVTTLMISPVAMNAPGGYHGYWPINLMAVDPRYGTMDDFKTLVREAHARGIRVVLDFVLNHTGPVFEYEDGPGWVGRDGGPKKTAPRYELRPTELAGPENFYRKGVIENWDDGDQIKYADFPPNLRHYNVERAETRDSLIKVAQWWIRETDVDGFRLDAYKHVAPSFWEAFHREVGGYAARLGKADFFMVGEISSGIWEEVAGHMGPGKLKDSFNYPAFREDNLALHSMAPTSVLAYSLRRSLEAFGAAAKRMLRFIDNQDAFRFLGRPGGTPLGQLKVALAYTLFSIGIPTVYYGTEQALRHIGTSTHYDPGSRGDMFAEGRYKGPGEEGDLFRTEAPMFRWLGMLASVRRNYAALRRGEQYLRTADENGPGIFAFSRILGDQEVVVVLNTAESPREADMWVDANLSPPGAEFVDALDPVYSAAARKPGEGGSKLAVSVPGYGVRVLVRRPRGPGRK